MNFKPEWSHKAASTLQCKYHNYYSHYLFVVDLLIIKIINYLLPEMWLGCLSFGSLRHWVGRKDEWKNELTELTLFTRWWKKRNLGSTKDNQLDCNKTGKNEGIEDEKKQEKIYFDSFPTF